MGRPLYVKMQSLARNTDLKLMAVGVVFIMLKAWPLVINIEVFYFHQSTLAQEIFASTSYGRTLQLLSVSDLMFHVLDDITKVLCVISKTL